MVSKIKCVCVFFGQYQERQASHCYVTRYLTIVCVCLCVCVGGGGLMVGFQLSPSSILSTLQIRVTSGLPDDEHACADTATISYMRKCNYFPKETQH